MLSNVFHHFISKVFGRTSFHHFIIWSFTIQIFILTTVILAGYLFLHDHNHQVVVFLMITALLIAILIGVLTTRRMVQPIAANQWPANQFIETLPISIIVLDVNAQIYYFNQAAQRLLGKPGATTRLPHSFSETYQIYMVGTSDLYSEEKFPTVRALYGETTTIDDAEIHRVGTETIPVEVSAAPIYNANNEIIFAVVSLKDISERKRAEMERRTFSYELYKINQQLEEYSLILEQESALHTAAIREREQTLRAVLQATTDTILMMELDGTIVTIINPAGQNKYKLSINEMIGRCVYDFLPPDVVTRRKALVDEVLQIHKPLVLEDERPNVCFEANFCPVLDDNGAVKRIVIFSRDITEHKRAERALRESEQRFRSLFDFAPIGIAWVSLEYRFVQVNQSLCDFFGYTPDELIGENFQNLAYPEDLQISQHYWRQLLTGEIHHCLFEERYFRKEGSVFWAQLNNHLLQDSVGKPLAFIIQIQDITERKQTEETLRLAQFSLDHSADGICWIGTNAQLLYVNESVCRALSYTREELLAMLATDFIPDFSLDHWPQEWGTFKSQRSVTFETFYRRKSGNIFPVEVAANYLEFNGKEYICAIARDITERKQAEALRKAQEERLESANRAKSIFLANMSHELRTPLNGILGYAQLLQLDDNLTDEQREGVLVIQQSGEHLLTLINDILDLSRIEAGKLELVLSDFRFPEFIKTIIELSRMRASQKGIIFIYEPLSALPLAIKADEKRLRQILLNLLSNAIKFTDNGCVTFSIGYRRKKFYFSIKDTGIGIAADDLEKIFLPFQQAKLQGRTLEGTRLGLPITQRLIEMMGGQLQVSSTLGKGSLFTFELTLKVITDVANMPTSTQIIGFRRATLDNSSLDIHNSSFTILVVDDKWQNRAFLINLLKPLGFTLVEAATGCESLLQARQFSPDAILMDLTIPDMNGFECTQRLRQMLQLQKTTIIAMSADVFAHNPQDSLNNGCTAFLPKPIDTNQLLQVLAEYCQLEWVYADTPIHGTTVTPAALTSPTFIVGPSPELALSLFELIKFGDIQGIIGHAKELAERDPSLEPFTKEVCQLAKSFKVRKLEEFVGQYIGK